MPRLIGFGEEGLFRCIGTTSLRRAGLSEANVALWSSVVFGLAHIANIIGGDARALGRRWWSALPATSST